HFVVEGLRPRQPEIDLQRGASVDGVELMRRLIDSPHRCFLDVKVTAEFLNDARHRGLRQLHDKSKSCVLRGNAPVIARHGPGEVLDDPRPIQTAQAIHEKLALIHSARENSRRRCTSRATSVAWASCLAWSIASGAMSH